MKHLSLFRDATAVLVTAFYVLPILWWALSSITPNDALLDIRRSLTFDYTPTFANFALAILGAEGTIYDSRQSLVDSVVVALASTAITLLAAVPAAFVLSQMRFRWRGPILLAILAQRFLPPIAIIVPLVTAYHFAGLIDSYLGLALAHASINTPVAILLMKSFMDDIPFEVSEAAVLDGASAAQRCFRILLPVVKGGVAATAILAFIFSWTEFMLSLFLTQNMRTVPVQAQILVMNMWGLISSLTVTALVPAFIFVLLVQKHLVRGLTMGLYK